MIHTRLSAFLLLVMFTACSTSVVRAPSSESVSAKRYVLDDKLSWQGKNREQLNGLMLLRGWNAANFDRAHPPVALFDWDNTVIKNDVGDATVFWLAAHDGLRHPGDWKLSNPYLSEVATKELNQACPGKKGDLIATSKNAACADTILNIYSEGKTISGAGAWSHSPEETIEPAYLWAVQFMAGYTENEVQKYSRKAIDFNLDNPLGTKQRIGTKDYPAYVRIYDQQKDLIRTLQTNGFDVWIITASAQKVVEVFAREVNIRADHVIGVRPVLDQNQRFTDRMQGCGHFAEGNTEIITYRQGKRCWVNKVIFGITDSKEMMDLPGKATFAAGDSDTDIYFVKDAQFKLVINRNKPELMCNAYENRDGNWLVNAMFIEPKGERKQKYSCGKYGIADQKDTAF